MFERCLVAAIESGYVQIFSDWRSNIYTGNTGVNYLNNTTFSTIYMYLSIRCLPQIGNTGNNYLSKAVFFIPCGIFTFVFYFLHSCQTCVLKMYWKCVRVTILTISYCSGLSSGLLQFRAVIRWVLQHRHNNYCKKQFPHSSIDRELTGLAANVRTNIYPQIAI